MDNNYNRGNGYNQGGYTQNGYNQNGYNQGGYNQNGYNPNGMNGYPPGQGPGRGSAIGSMVCGICSIVFCCCYGVVGIALGIVALVLWNKSKMLDGGIPSGMAKAGMVCGIIGLILSAIYLVILIAFWNSEAGQLYRYWYRWYDL